MQRAIINEGRNVRIPVHMATDVDKFERHSNAFCLRFGKDPSDDELLDILKIEQREDLFEIKEAALQESSSIDERIRQIQNGDKYAAQRLISANLHFVVNLALKFAKCKVPLMDLIQEGNLAMSEVVDKFKPEKKCKFSTFAYNAVRGAMFMEVVRHGKTVDLKENAIGRQRKLVKVIESLTKKLMEAPDEERVAEEMGISVEKLREFKESSLFKPVPLDEPLTENSLPLAEILPDKNALHTLQIVESGELCDITGETLSTLSSKEEDVMRRRFMIGRPKEFTLQEIADHYRLSRMRICQIEKAALKKLRTPAITDKLRVFLNA